MSDDYDEDMRMTMRMPSMSLDDDNTDTLPNAPRVVPEEAVGPSDDAPVESKPMRKRPAFWIAFTVIMVAMIAMFHPFGGTTTGTSSAVNDTPSVSSSATAPSSKSDRKSDEESNAGNDDFMKRAAAFDWDSLKGQKLSNAYELMRYDRLDPSEFDISIITNTGGRVLLASNWTVDSVKYSGDKRLLFHVSKSVDNGTSSNNAFKSDGNGTSGNAPTKTDDNAPSSGDASNGANAGKADGYTKDDVDKVVGDAKEALGDAIGKASQFLESAQ